MRKEITLLLIIGGALALLYYELFWYAAAAIGCLLLLAWLLALVAERWNRLAISIYDELREKHRELGVERNALAEDKKAFLILADEKAQGFPWLAQHTQIIAPYDGKSVLKNSKIRNIPPRRQRKKCGRYGTS